MSTHLYNSIDTHKTPGENMRVLRERIAAAKKLNTQLSQQFSIESQKRCDRFRAQQQLWHRYSGKLAEKVDTGCDEEHPVVLKLCIAVSNSRKRLLELRAEEEDAKRRFSEVQSEYRRVRGFWREQLGYLAGGRLALEPPSSVREIAQDTRRPSFERRVGGGPGGNHRFLSLNYFTRALQLE